MIWHFLRNELTIIFEELFTVKLFTEMTQIYDQAKRKKSTRRFEVDFGKILQVVGCKMFPRKLLKLKETRESLPTACGS